MEGDSEIDIYGETEDFGAVGDFTDENGGDGTAEIIKQDTEENNQNGEDLYDEVLQSSGLSERDGQNTSQSSISSSSTPFQRDRRHCLYVGNMTWWTTDQDLFDAVESLGIGDLLEIKFFDNRNNGQSKGFAIVAFTSEQSVRTALEKLAGKEIHGQTLVTLPYNKQSLMEFEAVSKRAEPARRKDQQGTPVGGGNMSGADMKGVRYLGTLRIGGSGGPPMNAGPRMHPPPLTGPPMGMPMLPVAYPPRFQTLPVVLPPPMNRGPAPSMNLPPPVGVPNVYPRAAPPLAVPPPAPGGPAPHINPNFLAAGQHPMVVPGFVPPTNEAPLSEAEFEEIMNRNKTVSSSAIARAVSDASAGDYASAIETLVTAISLIRQSRIAHDDRCKILITSLQDTLHGVEAKSYGRSERSSRDHSPSSSSRRKRHRSRSRSRDRHRDYSPRRYRY